MPSLRARYYLAMTLASSFVQLLESPWLRYITKESVVFAKRLGQAGGLALDEPHILQNLSEMAVVAESLPGGSSTGKHTSSSSLKAALKHFGILLLEIITWDQFENQNWSEESPQGPAQPRIGRGADANRTTDVGKLLLDAWIAEHKWIERLTRDGDVIISYTDVATWCLTGGYTDLSKWKEQMLMSIVRPLEECFNGMVRPGSASY